MTAKPVPPWFHNAVIEGVQMLYVLSLQGCPAAETITLTAQVWTETLWSASTWWNEAVDVARLQEAFRTLARTAERWPVPHNVLQNLPPRPERKALPEPALTPEQRAENVRRLRELTEKLFKDKVINK